MNFLDRKKMNLPTTNVADLFEDYGNAATARSIEGKLMRVFQRGLFRRPGSGGKFRLASALSPAWTCSSSDMSIGKTTYPLKSGWVCWPKASSRPNALNSSNLDKALWERDSKGQPRDPCQYTIT